jgi:imidazoleglycerol-phosphate dehydratase
MRRSATITRETKETKVTVRVTLAGTGDVKAVTGVKFLDHMLTSFATHSMTDMEIRATGDLEHHTVEDVALALGEAINNALGERNGIRRFGYAIVPMDDALALAAVDLVKRPYSAIDLKLNRVVLEDAPREDLEHIFPSLAVSMEATVHVKVLEGKNDHHKFEAAVKAFAIAFREAVAPDPARARRPPTSKGVM